MFGHLIVVEALGLGCRFACLKVCHDISSILYLYDCTVVYQLGAYIHE